MSGYNLKSSPPSRLTAVCSSVGLFQLYGLGFINNFLSDSVCLLCKLTGLFWGMVMVGAWSSLQKFVLCATGWTCGAVWCNVTRLGK